MRPIYFPPLPEFWSALRLYEVSDVIMGQSPPGDTYNENKIGLPFFQGKAEFGEAYPTPKKWCSSPTRVAQEGDILISVRAPVGATNLAKERCCIGRGLAAIQTKKDLVSRDFLLYYLKSIEDFLSTAGYGSTFQSINKKELWNLSIPLPPLLEQERIVHIIRQAESLNNLRSSFIDSCIFLKEKLLSDLLYNSNNASKKIFLGDITSFITSGSRDWSRFYTQKKDNPKFIRVQNIKNGVLNLSDCANVKPPDNSEAKRAKLEPRDILISITGTIGQAAFAPEKLGDAYISQHVAIVRTDGTLSLRFLVDFINHPQGGQPQIQRINYGQTKPGLNLAQIKEIRIPIIKSKLLKYYEQCATEIDNLIKRFNSTEGIYYELNKYLLTEAFTGNLTESWRKKNKTLLKQSADKAALGRACRQVMMTESAPEERPWPDQPNRHWLMDQLSDLQTRTYEALREWKGTLIPSEDLDEFREQSFSVEHLENANDRILRALHQLAELGLIARISLDNQEGDYVTAFRGLREEEFTQVSDRQYLAKKG